MFQLASIDWTSIAAFTGIVTAACGIMIWLFTRVFNIGVMAHRLETVEKSLETVQRTINESIQPDIKEMRREMSDKFEKLTIAVTKLEALYKQK